MRNNASPEGATQAYRAPSGLAFASTTKSQGVALGWSIASFQGCSIVPSSINLPSSISLSSSINMSSSICLSSCSQVSIRPHIVSWAMRPPIQSCTHRASNQPRSCGCSADERGRNAKSPDAGERQGFSLTSGWRRTGEVGLKVAAVWQKTVPRGPWSPRSGDHVHREVAKPSEGCVKLKSGYRPSPPR